MVMITKNDAKEYLEKKRKERGNASFEDNMNYLSLGQLLLRMEFLDLPSYP